MEMKIHAKIGTLPRGWILVKQPSKSVSDLQVGDVIEVQQHPFNKWRKWDKVRIYGFGDGLFLLERW